MDRIFCDNCDCLLNDRNPNYTKPRRELTVREWKFVVIVEFEGVVNTGDLCGPCFKELWGEAIAKTVVVEEEKE